VDDDLPDITGFVDLATLTEKGLIVTDYKTTRSSWPEGKAEENAGQLRLYAELLKQMFNGEHEIASLQFVTITKAKSPRLCHMSFRHQTTS
jgi:ATP-dependent exoDNAse (exonuclease V) beta subunit